MSVLKVVVDAGLFCVHLLRAFIHVQVDKIPREYILSAIQGSLGGRLTLIRATSFSPGRTATHKAIEQRL